MTRHRHHASRWMHLPLWFVFAFAGILFIVLWSLHGAGVIDLVGRE